LLAAARCWQADGRYMLLAGTWAGWRLHAAGRRTMQHQNLSVHIIAIDTSTMNLAQMSSCHKTMIVA
jgi:hypothetical protein